MADNYIRKLLGKGEEILLETHQHWFVVFRQVLPEVLVIITLAILVTMTWVLWVPNPLIALAYLTILIPVVSMIRDILLWNNLKYIITNRRVIQIFGVFSKNITDSSLEKVNDVKMDQSFLGRIFDYGDIEIMTASELGVNRFALIAQPIKFKIAMLNAKELVEQGYSNKSTPPAKEDISNLLLQLDQLKQKNVLTEDEFQKIKLKMIDSI